MVKDKRITGSFFLLSITFVVGACLGYLIAYLSGLHPSYIPLLSALIGLIVAFSLPLWQALFVNVPKLSIEINAINRAVSDSALISIDDEPELRSLKPIRRYPFYIPDDYEPPGSHSTVKKGGHTLNETEELFIEAKQRLRDLPSQIEERKKELDRVRSLTPSTFTKYECDRLNAPLAPEVDYDPNDTEKCLEALKDAYLKRLEELEKRYADLQSNLPAAERKIELLKSDLVQNRSYFTVSASLINSGRSNSAIKVPGLLRVSIGEGNYIDLKLTLKDFENKSEISANGTRIVIFESSDVSTLPEEDRKLINTYWGQSVSSRLHLEDIHSKTYSSNAIAFAEGLYQKIIYDRLARAASI